MYTVKEIAKLLGIHPATIYRYIKEGKLKPYKTPSGRFRFDEKHFQQLLGLTKEDEQNKLESEQIKLPSYMPEFQPMNRGLSSRTKLI